MKINGYLSKSLRLVVTLFRGIRRPSREAGFAYKNIRCIPADCLCITMNTTLHRFPVEIRRIMISHRGSLAVVSCLVLVCSPTTAGKLFEWVDKEGTAHFSDRAPNGLPYTKKTVKPATGPARQGSERGIRKAERLLLKNAGRRKAEVERTRQASARQSQERKSRCEEARNRYHDASHRPGTARRGDFKVYLHRMNEACD